MVQLGPYSSLSYLQSKRVLPHKLSLDNQGCTRIINLDSVEAYQPNSLFSPLTIGPLCHRDSVFYKQMTIASTIINMNGQERLYWDRVIPLGFNLMTLHQPILN